ITICVIYFLLALLWFITSVLIFAAVPEAVYEWNRRHGSVYHRDVIEPVQVLTTAFLAYGLSGLTWIQFALTVYWRHCFLKRHQSPPETPDSQNKMSLETHTKWILSLILACMIACFIEFGLSLGDGAYGGYSMWLILAAAVLTEAVHLVTLPLWKITTKRAGTANPPFIYSITLCVLVCLLALLWLVASIVSFLIVSRKFDNSKYIRWSTKGLGDDYRSQTNIRWAAAVLALFISGVMWAEFGLIVHYRRRFFGRVDHARNLSQSAAHGDDKVRIDNTPNPVNVVQSELVAQAVLFTGDHRIPSGTPGVADFSPYAQQQQQQQGQADTVNSLAYSPYVSSPVHHPSPVYNPVFQPLSPVTQPVSANPMIQGDE
ncbi:hypothetical protein FRC17_008515, partial [Serendipita sp. 399]